MTSAPFPNVARDRRFDFELSEAQERRALRLHSECIVFDMLSQQAGGAIFSAYPPELIAEFKEKVCSLADPDELWAETLYWPFELSLSGRSQLIQEWFRSSGLTCGTISDIRVHDGRNAAVIDREKRALKYLKLPWLKLALTAEDIRAAKKEGRIAMYANCQPTTTPPRDLTAFDRAYENGLRSFMLTYNRMDFVGVGCTERVDAGLSMFGADLVKHLNNIGMMVDVSHCGHATTLDACRISKRPVNANHTSAKRIFDHARGKRDDALRAIADTGGVIGVLALPAFLSSDARPTINCMLDHIDAVVEVVGWKHVAIGTDWPMQAPDDVMERTLGAELKAAGFREEDRLDVTLRLRGYDDCRDLPNVTRGLVKRGYNDEQIRGILGENALRVFSDVCG